jgi:hypothetical protein
MFCLFAKNMGDKLSEQRINIKFLVKLEKITHLQQVTASFWRENNE